MPWEWWFDAILAQTAKMKRDGALNASKSRINGFSSCNAPW
jgi:hypothetical protein